jgi:uncharacterized protein (TIGR02147 family)
MLKPPDISQYAGYAKYLQDAYAARKSCNRKFSHRFINQKMGIQSSGWFGDIIAGRQRLKPRHITTLAAIFKLESRERDFLRTLVEMEQACTPEEKAVVYEKWLELKGTRQEKVAKDRFKYFERWYYPALRELLSLYSFHGDYADLAAKLHPPIGPNQARNALSLLVRLGLINPGAPAPLPILVKDSSVKTHHWHKILKSYMQLAAAALKKFGKDERDFSAVTLTLSPEGLKKAGEEITALRRRLLALSERDHAKNRVYQCLFQVFPISQILESNHA